MTEGHYYFQTWHKIAMRNPWIIEAWDPPLHITESNEKKSIQELYDHFSRGNWCLGDCVYYRDICFINQVNGGSEYLVIRRDLPFESISANRFTLDMLEKFIQNVEQATDEQLKTLTYSETVEE
jgi:hypothetical protein